MDRALKKGPLGLHLAWLAASGGTKSAHDDEKMLQPYDVRVAGRATFSKLADQRGGVYREILEAEAKARGTRDELA